MASYKTSLFFFTLVFCSCAFAMNMECLMTMETEAKRCFQESGIDLNDPKYRISGGQNNMIFSSLMSEKPDVFCLVLDQSKSALSCLLNHAYKCLPPELRGYMPSSDAMGKAMDKICENKDSIDLQCVSDKVMDLFQCGQEEAKKVVEERGQMGQHDILCMAYKLNPKCQKMVLKSCGCNTAKVYTDISYDFLYPDSCPALNPNRVSCSRINQAEFIDDGLGNSGGSTLPMYWVLFLVAFLAIVKSRYSSI